MTDLNTIIAALNYYAANIDDMIELFEGANVHSHYEDVETLSEAIDMGQYAIIDTRNNETLKKDRYTVTIVMEVRAGSQDEAADAVFNQNPGFHMPSNGKMIVKKINNPADD